MTNPTGTPPEPRRNLPPWLLPAVILGAMALVIALVTVALTMRDRPNPVPAAAVELPTGHPAANEMPTTTGTSLPVAHGSVDPNGPKVELINVANARARLDARTAIFVDVRSGNDYAAGHIPGAVSITTKDLDTRIKALPAGSVIITYGDSARPDSGQRGAQIFMDQGYPTMIALEGGFQDWEKAGNPVEK
ncbi:MAG: rhodanese-like domain-containing protein [Chloroflexales bacterium]